jgi:hypothetical protein
MTTLPQTKLSQVQALMAAGDMRGACLMAAKFGELGVQRAAILSAREAYLRPAFQRQLGRDPVLLIVAGVKALQERFGNV